MTQNRLVITQYTPVIAQYTFVMPQNILVITQYTPVIAQYTFVMPQNRLVITQYTSLYLNIHFSRCSFTGILASIATAGVPEGDIFTMLMILQAANFDIDGWHLIYAVDWFL